MNYSIFDVDGTILDSMEVWNTLASQYVQSLGKVPEKNLDEIVSDMSLEQSATYLKKHYKINKQEERIISEILNFISDFYYATVELEITKDIDDNDVMDYMNVFQTTWPILKLNSDGTTQSFKTSACVGSDAETNQIGKTNFSFEKGETRTLILYYILSDEEVENDKLVISFSLKNSPFIGPLAIVHEPEAN